LHSLPQNEIIEINGFGFPIQRQLLTEKRPGYTRDHYSARDRKGAIMGETDVEPGTPPESVPAPVTPAKRKFNQIQRYSSHRSYTTGTLDDRRNSLMNGLSQKSPSKRS
jgi:hypothetical protein